MQYSSSLLDCSSLRKCVAPFNKSSTSYYGLYCSIFQDLHTVWMDYPPDPLQVRDQVYVQNCKVVHIVLLKSSTYHSLALEGNFEVFILETIAGTSRRRSSLNSPFSHSSSEYTHILTAVIVYLPDLHLLQQLVELEKSTGVQFRHIRLLAKAFTHSSMQYSSLVGYVC